MQTASEIIEKLRRQAEEKEKAKEAALKAEQERSACEKEAAEKRAQEEKAKREAREAAEKARLQKEKEEREAREKMERERLELEKRVKKAPNLYSIEDLLKLEGQTHDGQIQFYIADRYYILSNYDKAFE